MYHIFVITVTTLLWQSALSLPSKHSRRSATSSHRLRSPSEVLARASLEEESLVTEQELGGQCSSSSNGKMGLFKLQGRDAATCNDGSESGYYLLRQPGSTKWVVYLEGGWYCATEETCKLRRNQEPELMTSNLWKACKEGRAITSPSPSENPHLHESNMVYIPYCSSDVWSGTARNHRLGDELFSFMGSVIIEQVIMKLIQNHGMREATTILLTGSSAGGTGVFMNIDRVKDIISREDIPANVRGIVDSGWYLMRPEMENDKRCRIPHGCSAVALIKLGVFLWQPNIPRSCAMKYNPRRHNSINSVRRLSRDSETWKCFFGSVVYPYVQADVFIVQWIFDLVQLNSDKINLMEIPQSRSELLNYIENLYSGLNTSFSHVKGVFATSCLAHNILDNSDWKLVSVSQVTLPDAIQCWEINLDSKDVKDVIDDPEVRESDQITVERRHHHNRAELYNSGSSEEQERTEFATELVPDDDEYASYDPNYPTDSTEPPIMEPTQCKQKAIDPCPFPQCNPTCPNIYHPQTSSVVNTVDFLEHIGIDIRSMARNHGYTEKELLKKLSLG